MTLKLLALILGSVTLSALAQLLLKLGMSAERVQHALAHEGALGAAWVIATNLQVIGGLGLYGLGAAVWLLVLARVDVSFAYPFVGLGFILTAVLGAMVLHEPVGAWRYTGTALVALGVYLVAKS